MARAMRMDPSARGHLDAAVSEWLGDLGNRILTDARRLAPVDTSRLRDSLRAEVSGKVLRVGSLDCNYALYVEMGTGPHVITPRNKKALYWPGARHPVAKVNHPGTPAQPYLRPALLQRRTP
ncbi:HK97 gp10 family phage protein [Streptomyces cinnamoneus]|uniref:HK97 gp10 family phage protein n=1 Tax=Streptomyces cinnamoneus TaxID=53446 RepID=UPI0033C6CA16